MSKGTIAPTKPRLKRPVPRYDVTTSKGDLKGGTRTNVINFIDVLTAELEGEINIKIRRNSK
jgi:hypothetical protein